MNASPSPAAIEELRRALIAYDRAVFGELNATAYALADAARAAGYAWDHEPGVGPVVWARRVVGAQLQAQGDAVKLSDGEFADILASLRMKGLVDLDKDGDPILTDKGQVVLDQLKGEPS